MDGVGYSCFLLPVWSLAEGFFCSAISRCNVAQHNALQNPEIFYSQESMPQLIGHKVLFFGFGGGFEGRASVNPGYSCSTQGRTLAQASDN